MTDSTESTVVPLDSHPGWRAAQRRSRDLAEAMRRHPSQQSAPHTPRPERGVPSLCSHRDRKR